MGTSKRTNAAKAVATSKRTKATKRTNLSAAPTPTGPQNYNVMINVSEPEPKIFFVSVVPERVQLSGHKENTITWTLDTSHGAAFKSTKDIWFQTDQGKERFDLTITGDSVIEATVMAAESNQTIYTYELTVHFPKIGVALRIDPEVDNPPPAPGP
jgi:hypothetical protein